jgi:hypothetical protein
MIADLQGWITQKPRNASDSELIELIYVNKTYYGWVMSWGYSTNMLWRIESSLTDAALTELVLRELANERTLSAWFNPEILNLDPRIVAEMIARELTA